MNKHSELPAGYELPWQVEVLTESIAEVVTLDNTPVAHIQEISRPDNRVANVDRKQIAAFIVRAVNSHAELLAALEACYAQLEILVPNNGMVHDEFMAMVKAREAMTKAKGE